MIPGLLSQLSPEISIRMAKEVNGGNPVFIIILFRIYRPWEKFYRTRIVIY